MAPFEKPPECISGPNCPTAHAVLQVEDEIEVLRTEVTRVRTKISDTNKRVDALLIVMIGTLLASLVTLVFTLAK